MHKTLLMAAFFVGFISTAGINAQAEQNEPSKEKQSVKSLKIESVGSEFLGKINIEEATGYSGNDTIFFNLLSKGDIDNNGFDDLVIALHRHDTTMNYSGRDFEPSGAIKPIVLFYNEKTDNYSVRVSNSNPSSQITNMPDKHRYKILMVMGEKIFL